MVISHHSDHILSVLLNHHYHHHYHHHHHHHHNHRISTLLSLLHYSLTHIRILAVMSGNKALVPYLCRDQILKVVVMSMQEAWQSIAPVQKQLEAEQAAQAAKAAKQASMAAVSKMSLQEKIALHNSKTQQQDKWSAAAASSSAPASGLATSPHHGGMNSLNTSRHGDLNSLNTSQHDPGHGKLLPPSPLMRNNSSPRRGGIGSFNMGASFNKNININHPVGVPHSNHDNDNTGDPPLLTHGISPLTKPLHASTNLYRSR